MAIFKSYVPEGKSSFMLLVESRRAQEIPCRLSFPTHFFDYPIGIGR